MKKILLIASIILVFVLLIAGLTTPIFAHGPEDDGGVPTTGGTWETMYEACESGDWEAMHEAVEEMHGDDLDYMPCHDENDFAPANRWGGMGGHMSRGMMGGGWDGTMNGGWGGMMRW